MCRHLKRWKGWEKSNILSLKEAKYQCDLARSLKCSGRLVHEDWPRIGPHNLTGAADEAQSRLQYAGSVEEAAREADLVIEAVHERERLGDRYSSASTPTVAFTHDRLKALVMPSSAPGNL